VPMMLAGTVLASIAFLWLPKLQSQPDPQSAAA